MKTIEKEIISWHKFDEICDDIAMRVQYFSPDLIVGIARGGLPAATVLSHTLGNVPFVAVMAKKSIDEGPKGIIEERVPIVERIGWLPKFAARILLVDDVVAYGDIFCAVASEIKSQVHPSAVVKFASLYGDRNNIQQGRYKDILKDMYIGVEINNMEKWIIFPWECNE